MPDYAVEPITVTTDSPGKSRTLDTVTSLAEFLLEFCPEQKRAQQACLDALTGAATAEKARTAFAVAVIDAGYHILNVTRPERRR